VGHHRVVAHHLHVDTEVLRSARLATEALGASLRREALDPADRAALAGLPGGPALVSGEWNTPLLYIFAPLVGGVLAALTYWYLFVEGPGIRAATPETGPKGLRQDVNPPQ